MSIDVDVYFRIGEVCCGPFGAVAASGAEAAQQAVQLKAELRLPPETVVMITPAGIHPEWHHGDVEYLPSKFVSVDNNQFDIRIKRTYHRKLFTDASVKNQ
ncbi:hypothetical protein [Aeromonas simiae]